MRHRRSKRKKCRCGADIGVLTGSEMKCAGPAIRIAQRVNFRGASAARAADRLFVLPPFPPLAERCALIEVESIDKITLCLPQLAKASKIAPPAPAFGPAIEAIVDGRVGAILWRAIAPAGATLKHMNDAADDPPIVITFRSGQVSGQARRNACPLPVIQPKQPCAHRKPPVPNRSVRENQNALIRYRP